MSAAVREQPSKRRDEGTLGGPQPRTLLLASQDPELVPQQHEFHVLINVTTSQAAGEQVQRRRAAPGSVARSRRCQTSTNRESEF
jgi:hypothetical protein